MQCLTSFTLSILYSNQNNKVDSFETGRIVIAGLIPWSDLEKGMNTTHF